MWETVHPKFIVENGKLIIGKVCFHRELAKDEKNVVGGGWWKFDHQTSTFSLYGQSEDFGPVEKSILEKCIADNEVYENRSLHKKLDTTVFKFVIEQY